MATGTHKAILEVDAKVATADKALRAMSKRVGQLEKKLDKVNKSGGAAAAAIDKMNAALTIGGAIGAIKTLDELADRSLKYQGVMKNLPFSIDKAREATKGMASDFDLAKSAVSAARFNITKTDEEFAKLVGSAQKLSLSVGGDATEAMERLTLAIGRGSAMRLDDFGILMTDAAFKALTMAERLELVAHAADAAIISIDENTTSWMRMKAELENLIDATLPATQEVMGFVADEIRQMTEALSNAPRSWSDAGDAVVEFGRRSYEALIPVNTILRRIEQGMDDEGTNKLVELALSRAAKQKSEKLQEVGAKRAAGRDEALRFVEEGGGMEDLQGPLPGASASDFASSKKRGGRRKKPTGPVGPAGSRFDTSSLHGLDLGATDAENVREASASALEREIELMKMHAEVAGSMATSEAEVHSTKMAALEETFDAEIRLAEMRDDKHQAEVLRLQKQMELRSEENRHSEELAKMEAKRQADRLKHQQQILSATQSVGDGLIQTASAVTSAMGLEGEKQAKAEGIIQGTRAMFIGGLEMVKAVSSFAGFNYIEGAAHLAAATFAFVQGGLMMAGTPPGGGGGGGAGAPGGSVFAGGGSGGGFGQAPNSNIPASPNGSAPSGTQGGGQSGSVNHVNVTVNQTGAIDEDSAMKIKQGLEDLDLSRGNVNS